MSKKKDKNNGKKGNNSKESNVVPFTKSLKDQKIETDQEIWNKMDSFSRELVKAFKDRTHNESIDHDHCWYIFYYRVMQEMMFQMSWPALQFYKTSVSRQLLKHHKEFMNSFDEWTSNPEDEEDLFGRRSKIIKKDKTLH
tara:strand:+ start:381 stop:800 length:420 start_codon:yes stop_codon:yes gene_type:complete